MRQYVGLLCAALTTSLILGAIAGAAVAGPLEDGLAAANRGDYATAYRLWRPLADQGNARVQTFLGIMYFKGDGVPQDYAESVIWYRKAADQGEPDAQNNLGQMYSHGEGVPQDYVQSHMWLNLAASRYTDSEKAHRDNAINGRDYVASLMTPSQIAEAQKLAREWKPNKSERAAKLLSEDEVGAH